MPVPEAHYVAARPSSPRDLPSGTITLLFTDIEGSTRLLQQLGAHYEAVLADYRRLMRTAIERWNGYEVDTQGDAFFVAFTRAIDAVEASMDVQRALTSHAFPGGVAMLSFYPWFCRLVRPWFCRGVSLREKHGFAEKLH